MVADFNTPRLYLADNIDKNATLPLTGDMLHYIGTVMRLQNGAQLRVFNAESGEWLCQLELSGNKKGNVKVLRQLRTPLRLPDLHLFCAPIKKNHFDFTLVKATELGITHIHPILTERTQIREINLKRLTIVAKEAAEQSERLCLPEIHPLTPLTALTKSPYDKLTLFLGAESGAATPIAEAFQAVSHNATQNPAGFIIGPEGGFSAQEFTNLLNCTNIKPVSLGPRILRAETAAMACLACWQAINGDWRTPRAAA